MSGQELTVAVQHRLPVIFVVMNDQALGMVKHGQRLGGGEPIGYELPPVDFAGVARAMGAQAHTILEPDDFASLDMAAICNAGGPTLLDVHIDPEEVPPIQARMKVLRADKTVDG
jgi:acetolactate synthase-1/2/3 large subunit